MRNDLNIYHILARGGIIQQHDNQLLSYPNKNGWLPIHLSKNKEIAQHLYPLTKQYITDYNIVVPALMNNAESMQTKYGHNLYNLFIEKGFNSFEAKKSSIEPSFANRINLSSFWLTMLKEHLLPIQWEEVLQKVIPIALQNSNSFFFFALLDKFSIEQLQCYIKGTIGNNYYVSDRAYQLYQIVKQNFKLELTIIKKEHQKELNLSPLENLEGY